MSLTATCLCLLTRTSDDGVRQVLLGHKKTGLGTGKIVGLGGHVEEYESPAEAAAREVKEESGIHVLPGKLREMAHVTFLFPARPSLDMTASIFTSADWTGQPVETVEIRPEWFAVTALPYDCMWDDARQWLPSVLAGRRIRATFTYARDNETVVTAAISELG